MFYSNMNNIEEIKETKCFISNLDLHKGLQKFRDFWLFESKEDERIKLMRFTGFYFMQFGPKRSSYKAVMELPHFKQESYDRQEVLKSLKGDTKTVLSKIYGRALESENYRAIDVLFSSKMSPRLFKYMSRLGLYKPEELLRLYNAGGLGNELRFDAENVLSEDFIDEVIPKETEACFASNINDLLNCVNERKYGYIRVATYVKLPHDIAKVLGRNVRATYDGDICSIVERMEESGKYSEDEISFLYDFNKEGIECASRYNLSNNRMNTLIRDMRMQI